MSLRNCVPNSETSAGYFRHSLVSWISDDIEQFLNTIAADRGDNSEFGIGPEQCAGIREDVGEASVGERAGQPLSRDRKLIPAADAVRA